MKSTRNALNLIAVLSLTSLLSACGADHNFDSGDKLDTAILSISGETSQLAAGPDALTEASFDANVKANFATSCDRCHSAPTYAESVALAVSGDAANSAIYKRATGTLHHRVVWRTTSPEAAALAKWINGN